MHNLTRGKLGFIYSTTMSCALLDMIPSELRVVHECCQVGAPNILFHKSKVREIAEEAKLTTTMHEVLSLILRTR